MPLAANPSAPDASAVPCLLGQPQMVTRVHTRMVGCFLALPVQTNQALKHTTHNDGGGHQGVKVRRGCPFTKPHATAAGAHAGSIASCHPRSPSLPSHKTCLVDTRWMLSWRGVTLRIILEMRRDLQLAFRENPSHCRDNGCTYYHAHVVLPWMRVPPARQAAASFIIRSVREADEAFSWRLHLFMLHLGCQFFVRALRETPLGLWRLWCFLWRVSEGREPVRPGPWSSSHTRQARDVAQQLLILCPITCPSSWPLTASLASWRQAADPFAPSTALRTHLTLGLVDSPIDTDEQCLGPESSP